jgi:hypothetical protein
MASQFYIAFSFAFNSNCATYNFIYGHTAVLLSDDEELSRGMLILSNSTYFADLIR